MKAEELFVNSNELPYGLSDEETRELLKKIKQGDIESRNILIEHNIRLILYIVSKKFWNNEYDKEELVSIGSIGLIKAANTFDIGKKTRFSTYAARCIINEILMYLKNEKKYPQTESLNESVYKNEDSKKLKLEDTINDNTNLEEDYIKKESYDIIMKLVDQLPPRDKEIILLRFGFYDKPHTQKEIGEIFNITPAGISDITIRVLKKIKKQYTRKCN